MKEEVPSDIAIENRLNKLIETIYAEAKQKVEEIKSQTKEELDEYEQETARIVEETKKKEIEKESYRVELQKKRLKAQKEQEAKSIMLEVKERLIDQVMDEVLKAMQKFREMADYEKYLEARIGKLINMIHEPEIRILIDQRDSEIVKKVAKKLARKVPHKLLIEEKIETLGGFIITDNNERIRIDATIEYLFKAREEIIRSKINQLLFEEGGG